MRLFFLVSLLLFSFPAHADDWDLVVSKLATLPESATVRLVSVSPDELVVRNIQTTHEMRVSRSDINKAMASLDAEGGHPAKIDRNVKYPLFNELETQRKVLKSIKFSCVAAGGGICPGLVVTGIAFWPNLVGGAICAVTIAACMEIVDEMLKENEANKESLQSQMVYDLLHSKEANNAEEDGEKTLPKPARFRNQGGNGSGGRGGTRCEVHYSQITVNGVKLPRQYYQVCTRTTSGA